MAQKASLRQKGKGSQGTWYVWFRHPVLQKPFERSLKTTHAEEAEDLVSHLNIILADREWHTRIRPGTPAEIVAAFYEPIKGQLTGDHFEELEPEFDGRDGASISPQQQAKADSKIADESFQVLFLKRRIKRLKWILAGRKKKCRHMAARVAELERKMTGSRQRNFSELGTQSGWLPVSDMTATTIPAPFFDRLIALKPFLVAGGCVSQVPFSVASIYPGGTGAQRCIRSEPFMELSNAD